jgi:hypothetical protein
VGKVRIGVQSSSTSSLFNLLWQRQGLTLIIVVCCWVVEVIKVLILEFDAQFSKQLVLDAMDIVYP